MLEHGTNHRATLFHVFHARDLRQAMSAMWATPRRQRVLPSPFRTLRTLGVSLLLALTLVVGANGPLAAGFGIGSPLPAHAQGLPGRGNSGKPNRFDPHANASSTLHLPSYPKSTIAGPAGPPQPISHGGFRPRGLGSVAIDAAKGTHFASADGTFQVDVPARAVSAADLAAAGGKLSLQVAQIAPPSGSNAGGSGIVSFGMFLLQVVDAHGVLAKQGLRQPVSVRLDYGKAAGVDLQHAFVTLNGSVPATLTTATAATTTAAANPALTPAKAQPVSAAGLALGKLTWQNTALDSKNHLLTLSPLIFGTPSTSMTWNTTGPIAYFGKPDLFNADLSAGALSAGLPIDVPAGPGGLTPPISLAYSSAGVSENHSVQGAAGWAGEGWNLNMGSINWSEKDGIASCVALNSCNPPCPNNPCQPLFENSWQLSDPYGTGSELIPPNNGVSTYFDDTPNTYYSASYSAQVLGLNPDAWWRQGESSGPTAADSSGHGRNGTYTPNGGTITYGNPGALVGDPTTSVHFNTNPYVDIPHDSTLDTTSDFTIMGWVKFDSVSGGVAMASTAQSTGGGIVLGQNSGVLELNQYGNGLPGVLFGSGTMTTGVWHLVAGTYVASTTVASIYLDGALNASRSGITSLPTSADLWLGNDFSGDHLTGYMQDWAFWGRALQASDINNLWLAGSSGTGTSGYHNVPAVWHTASESYARIVSYRNTAIDFGNGVNPLCFRVWLKNGLMEEFGCTSDSLQEYVGTPGGVAQYRISGWLLDMITDPQGNQIHFTYQRDMQTQNGLQYPRDVVLSTIEWDSPSCHNAQTMCTGSSWAPLMRVSLSAVHTVPSTHLTNTPSGCNTSDANIRCDDPKDLSNDGHQDLTAPAVQNTFALTDIYVQVRSSGTGSWNTLKDYQLSYEQNGPGQITDGSTGKAESTAGYLDLTKIAVVGDDGATALPTRTFGYTTLHEYYVDDTWHPNPTTNCGPADGSMSWNTGNGSGCLLWSRSEDGNSRYLSSASNGMGLAQTFTWANARNNTHGVNSGQSLANPLACNDANGNPIGGYPCNEADDQDWSHAVLTKQQGDVMRAASGGNQDVSSITAYTYFLTTGFAGMECGDCSQGMYWGNENENDYLDYYNGHYMGFAETDVSNPDGSLVKHKFYATTGWGVYDNSQITGCVPNMQPPGPTPCPNDPWWNLTNAAHGHEYETDSYDTNGTTLLKKMTTQYQALCPPSGVSGTGSVSGYGNFNGNLVSELDLSNPVAVCDVQTTRTDAYTYDGSNPSTVPDAATTYTYDGDGAHYGRVTSSTSSSNNGGATGSPTTIVSKTSYIWDDAVSTTQTSATGTYLIDFAAFKDTEDSSGNRYSCDYTSYDGQGYALGQQGGLTLGEVTTSDKYTNCGTSPNWTPSGLIETKQTYDTYGNHLTTIDPDANAGISGHVGCTVGTMQYSTCDAFDTTFEALPISSKNALNQTTTTGYNAATDPAGGFGLWPTSTTDANNQTTTYGYDALGRMLSETLPGEGTGLTTLSWNYTFWCTATGAQTPCAEVDQTQRLSSTTTVVSRAFYDGYGNLVETRDPAPNGQDIVRYRNYDASGRDVFDSISYFVTAYTGGPGSAAFSVPDSTQPGTKHADSTATPPWYGYDGLGRTIKVQDALSNFTTTSYTVVCNAAGTGDSACYEQTLAVDPLSHQSSTLTDALGRETYDQRYTGNSSNTYAVYATTKDTYDYNGNLTQILQPDGASKTTFTYDMASRKTGMTDPDRGTESYTYDADGNLTQSVDGRGSAGTYFAGYDGLDRPIWRNTSNSPTGAYVTYTYDSTAGGNDGMGRLTSEAFTGGPSNTLSGSYSYVYDARGQQTSATTTVGSSNYTVQKTYDDTGTVLTQTYPDGEVVTYSYTAQEWLTGLSTPHGGVTIPLLSNASYTGVGGAAKLMTGATLGANPNTLEDNFTRANRWPGWGTSTNNDGITNAAWGLDGTASNTRISNNTGVFGDNGANVVGIASFGTTTHDGGDALAKWSISNVGTGVPFISLNACADKSCYYGARVNTATGNLEIARESGGRTTVETVSSFPIRANTPYWTRLNVNHSGSSTVVRAKIWQDGAAEPAAWTLSWADSSPLAAGLVGAGGTWVGSGNGQAISYFCYGYSATPGVPAAACGAGKYTYSASYDQLLRATDLKWTRASDGATLFEQARTFDGAGNVTTATATLPAGSDNQAFCYDEQNRLTWASSQSGSVPCGGTNSGGTLGGGAQYTQSFAYDTLGRLTSGPLGSYSYGPGMQAQTNPSPLHAALSIGSSYTAKYDGAGNMTCRAPTNATTCSGTQTGAQLSYDQEGRLGAWQNAPSSPTTTTANLYDGDGNRVEQQVTTSGTTTTTVYVTSLEEVAITGSSATTTTYYYAGAMRIAEAVNGVFSYLADDGLSSANLAQGASGTTQASTLYAPYGTTRYSSGTMPTDYGFTGQHADSATGLDYYNARYYDATAGQFTSADSVLPGDGHDVWGLSRYAYVEGNPEARTDPNGHFWPCDALIGAAAGAVVGGIVAAVPMVQAVTSGKPVTGQMWMNLGVNMVLGAGAGAAIALNPGGAIAGVAGTGAGIGLGMLFNGQTDLQSGFQQLAVGAIGGAAGGWLGGKLSQAVMTSAISPGAGALFQFGAQGGIAAGEDALTQGAAILTGQQGSFNWAEFGGAGLLTGLTTVAGSYLRKAALARAARYGSRKLPISKLMKLRAAMKGVDKWWADAVDAKFQFAGNLIWNYGYTTRIQSPPPYTYIRNGTRYS